MDLYVILRRDGWRSADELELAAARSTAEGERMPDDIRWIRSYVLEEGSGLGTVCIYEASSPEALRRRPLSAAAHCPAPGSRRGTDPPRRAGRRRRTAFLPRVRQSFGPGAFARSAAGL